MDEQEAWKVALLRAEPRFANPIQNSALFVLYCIGTKLCSTLDDFYEHFVVSIAFIRHLTRLKEEGFLEEKDDHYVVTALGWEALRGFTLPGGEDEPAAS